MYDKRKLDWGRYFCLLAYRNFPDDGDVGEYPGLHLVAGVVHDDPDTTALYIDGSPVVIKFGLGNGNSGCQNFSCM